MFSCRVHHPFTGIEELAMRIIAWILIGLVSGLLAHRLFLGKNA